MSDSEANQKIDYHTVTAALPYVNGPKHIGHLAGAYLPADVYARYLRLVRKNVIFVCGSDEHGTAIPNQALKEKTSPKAIADKYHALIRDTLYHFGISFDVYYRTSEPMHHQLVQRFFTVLHDKDILQKKKTAHFYDSKVSTFLADRYIKGTCPHCNYHAAYGDQCEQCGTSLSPEELIDPCSALTGDIPVLKQTTHWYLPLQKYEKWLRHWILESHAGDWKSNVKGQCKSWLEAGLRPRAITRDLDWGVKVPLQDVDKKVLYVWFDAPIGYMSATKALFDELKSGVYKYATPQRDFGSIDANSWQRYWQKDAHITHFVGKDNIVFHCIIFPVMLHAHGGYALPENVPANEFMNLEGDKMSTSRGWSVEMHEYIDAFPDKQDELRYTLLTHLPENKDSEFTWKSFQQKNNNELVAILGNFVNRTLSLIHRYYGGKVPSREKFIFLDEQVLKKLDDATAQIGDAIQSYQIREAVQIMMNLAREGNKYLTDTEPWKLIKTDSLRTCTVLYVALQIVANLSVLTSPFLPFTAIKICKMLNIEPASWATLHNEFLIEEGHVIQKPILLYDVIDDEKIATQVERLHEKKNMANHN